MTTLVFTFWWKPYRKKKLYRNNSSSSTVHRREPPQNHYDQPASPQQQQECGGGSKIIKKKCNAISFLPDCEVCSIRPLVACEPFRCFPPSTGWSIPQEHTHTRDVTLGNRFRNFFSISRHFQRPLTVHRAPTVATSRCQSGRCRPPQQQQQQQTHQHRVRARSIDKERPPNLPLRLLLPTEILFAVVFFVESLFLLPPRINLA